MKNLFASLFRSVIQLVGISPHNPSRARKQAVNMPPSLENQPALTREQFRRMLAEALAADPNLARRILMPLSGTVFPIEGGVAGDTGYLVKFTDDSGGQGRSVVFEDSLGRIGIGTATPVAELDVLGQMNLHDGNSYAIFYKPNNSASSYLFRRGTPSSYTELVRIDNAGKVGIGTPTPAAELDVVGQMNLHDGNSYAIFYKPDVANTAYLFRKGTPAGPYTELVRIDNNGNVGIGTVSPLQRLTLVQGSKFAVEMSIPTGVSAALADNGSLTVGQTYYYVVTALDAAGETLKSSEVSATPTSGTPDKRTIHLSWTPVTGATSYKVYWGTAPNGENKYYSNITTNSFDHSALTGTDGQPPLTPSAGTPSMLGSSLILGTSATQQTVAGGGPELLTAMDLAQDRVVLWSGKPGSSPNNAMFLSSIRGFLEWGGGGTNDQDVALFRNGPAGLSIQNFTNTKATRAFSVNAAYDRSLGLSNEEYPLFVVNTQDRSMRLAPGIVPAPSVPFFPDSDYVVTRGEKKTTDATQTTLGFITLTDGRAYYITVRVVGRKSDGTQRAFYWRAVLAYRQGGNAVIEGGSPAGVVSLATIESSGAGSWDCTLDTTGGSNDVRVRVTGQDTTTIYWVATIEYQSVSTDGL
ncbi:MAG: hypothetical protein A3J28_17640 [Acidobacteria bacterium RIFCSPLOWO2_12_FULL_60_22]|nr:MAG: hypothetical protein A3J28_17640 [Acidobacteria bacterium RIFCSPLOWO2_12_FULL_60_22]